MIGNVLSAEAIAIVVSACKQTVSITFVYLVGIISIKWLSLTELCIFRKKRGHKPTGMLVQKAKATGFSSVSEMLQVKGLENLHGTTIKDTISAKKQTPLTKVCYFYF